MADRKPIAAPNGSSQAASERTQGAVLQDKAPVATGPAAAPSSGQDTQQRPASPAVKAEASAVQPPSVAESAPATKDPVPASAEPARQAAAPKPEEKVVKPEPKIAAVEAVKVAPAEKTKDVPAAIAPAAKAADIAPAAKAADIGPTAKPADPAPAAPAPREVKRVVAPAKAVAPKPAPAAKAALDMPKPAALKPATVTPPAAKIVPKVAAQAKVPQAPEPSEAAKVEQAAPVALASPLGWTMDWAATATARAMVKQERLAREAAAYRQRWLDRQQEAAQDLAGLATAVLAPGAQPQGAALDRIATTYIKAAARTFIELREQVDLALALARPADDAEVKAGSQEDRAA